MRYLGRVLLSFLLLTLPLYGAAYMHVSPAINTPKVQLFEPGDMEFFTGMAYANEFIYDFDFGVRYAITEHIKIGATLLHADQLIGAFQYTFFENDLFGMASGLNYITNNNTPTDMSDYTSTKNIQFSPYIVAKFKLAFLQLNIGAGTGEYVGEEYVSGLFGSLEIGNERTALIIEHDAKNINVGVRLTFSDNANFHFAATEMPYEDYNSEYSNQPTRYLTTGLSVRKNVWHLYADKQIEYDRQKAALDLMRKEMKLLIMDYQNELDNVKNTQQYMMENYEEFREDIDEDSENRVYSEPIPDEESPTYNQATQLNPNLSNADRVFELYNSSFEAYLVNDYQTAISNLTEAILLAPDIADLYIKLGTIYYDIGLEDLAMQSWKEALRLEPDNKDLLPIFSE